MAPAYGPRCVWWSGQEGSTQQRNESPIHREVFPALSMLLPADSLMRRPRMIAGLTEAHRVLWVHHRVIAAYTQVADFGISRVKDPLRTYLSTRGGGGTAPYMAPEQLGSMPIDEKVGATP